MDQHDTTLFLTRTGERFNENWLSLTVARYVDRSNVGKRGSCHLFRHTMATLMLENGCDIRFIQAMLGHAELSTTEIYTQVAIKVLKQVHSATHPTAARGQATRGRKKDQAGEAVSTTVNELLAGLDAEAADEDDICPDLF